MDIFVVLTSDGQLINFIGRALIYFIIFNALTIIAKAFRKSQPDDWKDPNPAKVSKFKMFFRRNLVFIAVSCVPFLRFILAVILAIFAFLPDAKSPKWKEWQEKQKKKKEEQEAADKSKEA